MKDRLGAAAWWNAPIANPTQTSYTRLMRVPWGELSSPFTAAQADFRARLDNAMKSRYLDGDFGGAAND